VTSSLGETMMLKQHTRLLGAALGLATSAVLVSAGAAGASAGPQARSGTVPGPSS
jgi:hypothetical protein